MFCGFYFSFIAQLTTHRLQFKSNIFIRIIDCRLSQKTHSLLFVTKQSNIKLNKTIRQLLYCDMKFFYIIRCN